MKGKYSSRGRSFRYHAAAAAAAGCGCDCECSGGILQWRRHAGVGLSARPQPLASPCAAPHSSAPQRTQHNTTQPNAHTVSDPKLMRLAGSGVTGSQSVLCMPMLSVLWHYGYACNKVM